MLLEVGELSGIGGDYGFKALQFWEEFGMLAEVVDAVCVEDDETVVGEALDHFGEKVLHVFVSAQARPDHPAVDGLFPGLQLPGPVVQHLGLLLDLAGELLAGDEEGVRDNFGRI